RVVQVEKTSRDDRARSSDGSRPAQLQPSTGELVCAGSGEGRDEEPRPATVAPDRRGGEQPVADRHRLQLATGGRAAAAVAVEPAQVEEPKLAVLAALRREPRAEDGGRGRAEVDVAVLERLLVRRRPVLEEAARTRREQEDAVPPV